MPREVGNRIGYMIAMFIIVPCLIIMLILKPTASSPDQPPANE